MRCRTRNLPAGCLKRRAHVQTHVVVHNFWVVPAAAPEVVGAEGVIQRRRALLRNGLVCKIGDPCFCFFDIAISGRAGGLQPAGVHCPVLDVRPAHAVLRPGPRLVRRPQPLAAAVFRVEAGKGSRTAGLLSRPVICPRDAVCTVCQNFTSAPSRAHRHRHGRARAHTLAQMETLRAGAAQHWHSPENPARTASSFSTPLAPLKNATSSSSSSTKPVFRQRPATGGGNSTACDWERIVRIAGARRCNCVQLCANCLRDTHSVTV